MKSFSFYQLKSYLKRQNFIRRYISDVILLLMISIYCYFEYQFNVFLFEQMSQHTSRLAIDHVELLGRTLSGFGLALLAVKYYYNKYKKDHWFVPISLLIQYFVIASVIAVPLSFVAQTYIVKAIVSQSNPAERRDALLTASVNSTFMPYYNETQDIPSRLHYSISKQSLLGSDYFNPFVKTKYENHLTKQDEFYNLAQTCTSNIENSQTQHVKTLDAIGRAFYGLRLLNNSQIDREELEDHITSYYKCLVEDEKYWQKIQKELHVNEQIKATEDALEDRYRYYDSKSDEYFRQMDKARWNIHKRRIEEEWRKGIEWELGEGVYVEPGLSYDRFINIKAVKNKVLDEDVVFTVYDSEEDIKRKFLEGLPNIVLVGYEYYRERGDAYDKQQRLYDEYGDVDCGVVECYDHIYANEDIYSDSYDYGLEEDEEEKRKRELKEAKIESGKQSYKAIIIPMVALVLSLFFLGTNIISIFTFIISLFSKKLALAITIGAVLLYSAYPHFTDKQMFEDEEHKYLSKVINWAGFYQKKVYDLQDRDS